jgi:hypothetical protein
LCTNNKKHFKLIPQIIFAPHWPKIVWKIMVSAVLPLGTKKHLKMGCF